MLLKNPALRASIIKKPITVTENILLLESLEILQKFRISRLVVIDRNSKPIGIITEKDILRGLYPIGAKRLSSLQIKDLMSKDLVSITKKESVYQCAKLMKDNGISSLVVLNESGSLEGILTKTDLVFNFLSQETAPLPISKIMTKKVVTVDSSDPLFLVESTLINNKISRVPVLKNQKLVGIITHRDFIPTKMPNRLGVFPEPQEFKDVWFNPHLNQFNVNSLSYVLTFRAEDIMTKNPVTARAQDDVSLAALIMYRYGISGIPVVKQSKLNGIITKSDIVFALAKEV